MNLYYLGNARHSAQAETMRRMDANGTCVFCAPLLDDEHDELVVIRGRHWVARHNAYPYAGTRLHLLLVPRRHVVDVLDLPDEELAEVWSIGRRLREQFELRFYGLGARCGDCAFTGGTIVHVHVHLVVGDVDDPEHRPVRVKLSSRPATAQPESFAASTDVSSSAFERQGRA